MQVGNTHTGVQGQYSYVDANGIEQHVSYIADDNGFRVLSDSRLENLKLFKNSRLQDFKVFQMFRLLKLFELSRIASFQEFPLLTANFRSAYEMLR